MNKPLSERRLVENEAVFRKFNQQIQKGFEELKIIAKSEGQPAPDMGMPMHFYCECSDENCRKRIIVGLSEYRRAHRNEKHFFVLPGHDTELCEKVIRKLPGYHVVQKFMVPPKDAFTLKPTPVSNV